MMMYLEIMSFVVGRDTVNRRFMVLLKLVEISRNRTGG